jgi:serine/threonine protein kinase
MADVYALCRGVIKSIRGKKLKFNHCQRELLAKTFAHFLDNLESAFRKDHTKDDCLRMCAKALSELWRVMTYAEIMVTEWGNEDWWRTAMCSSVSGSLQLQMNLLLQEFLRCLDIAKIAIAEATGDQAFKLPIMDHSQFFAAIVDEAYKRDNQSLKKDVRAFKKNKTFVQRKFGSSYGLSKYLLRKLRPDTPSSEPRRSYSLDFHYIEMTKTTLGKGSIGTVFECKCFGMPVVAKCLALTGEESVKSLEADVELLASLQHVNLVQFIGYAVHENQHYLITERGSETLTTYLTRHGAKPLSHFKAFDILLQVAQGMKYLHEQNVVHGDLKASNIILDATERKKDGFWCVQARVSDYGLTGVKLSLGPSCSNSMSWKAPEIYDCKSENSMELYTKASDVYSFAMTMYEVLTGCKPFEALSPSDLKASLLAGWRPAVKAKSQCPGYLIAFMQRCWAGKPEDRPLFSDVCNMLCYCKGVILRHSFPSPLSCINEYDAEVLSSQLGAKWCIQEGAKGNLPVEVYSYATFDIACRSLKASAKTLSGVDEVEEVMKAGRYFGNWSSQACDLEKSFKLFRSVSHNHPEALWRLGLCYEIGMGVAVSELKAMTLYEQARALNFPSAYVDIGHCYAAGHGVPQSIEHAKRNWASALHHQAKASVPLLAIQELLQNLSAGTTGCTLDSDKVYSIMASRLQELTKHEIGRVLINGPDSCNGPLLEKILQLQARKAAAAAAAPIELIPTTTSPDSSAVQLKHVLGTSNHKPQLQLQLQRQQPPPAPAALQPQQLSRIVLLKGAGDHHRLKRRHAASGSSPVTLIIIAALLCLIVAILVKHFHDIASHRRFLDEIRIDHSAS